LICSADPPDTPWQSFAAQKALVAEKPSVHGPVMFSAMDAPMRQQLKMVVPELLSVRTAAIDMMVSA
jgi:hypothetical protein